MEYNGPMSARLGLVNWAAVLSVISVTAVFYLALTGENFGLMIAFLSAAVTLAVLSLRD